MNQITGEEVKLFKDKQLKDKAINLKGKLYVQVKDRVDFFNENFPDGMIETKLLKSDGIFIVKATVTPDASSSPRFFTGMSQASFDDVSPANKTAPLEVAETSAVGRALGFMGIGVIDGIASADEVVKATREPSPLRGGAVQNAIDTGLISKCKDHGDEMVQKVSAKTGNPYWSHRLTDGTLCFGKVQR